MSPPMGPAFAASAALTILTWLLLSGPGFSQSTLGNVANFQKALGVGSEGAASEGSGQESAPEEEPKSCPAMLAPDAPSLPPERIASSHPCPKIVDMNEIQETGGWCLVPNPDKPPLAPGRPLAIHHLTADQGIARTIAEFVPETDTLLDLGAGIGQYQLWFMDHGVKFARYLGFDGASNVESFTWGSIRFVDASVPIHWSPHEVSDWVMSLEVAEHIPPERECAFVDNLHRANKKGIILSWGLPGQDGFHHVNCKPNSYVIKTFERLGYTYLNETSELGRSRAQYWWFNSTFMVFRRNGVPGEGQII